MRLIILMSSFNGEKYIREQLDSILNQNLTPDKIFIRDDGSIDQTVSILEEYAMKNNCIEYYSGENLGPAGSFFELINRSEKADYYSLCDQDDVWFEDKLSRAVSLLEKEDNGVPLLYCSKYTLTDQNLNPINSDVSSLYGFSDFPHSLIYHTAPGCTFVFNNEARKHIVKYDVRKEYCLIHDAIIHKVVCMFGKMILDSESHMYYRQHGNNEIGMSSNKIKVFLGRINRFVNGRIKNYRSNTAKSLLKVYGKECGQQERDLLNMVANYMYDSTLKKKFLREKQFRSGTINDLFFIMLITLNYI